jgi:hypothetical protein
MCDRTALYTYPERLVFFLLIKICPLDYVIREFIVVSTSARHWAVASAG